MGGGIPPGNTVSKKTILLLLDAQNADTLLQSQNTEVTCGIIAQFAAQRWTVTAMADETGTVLPWEKDAMAGLEMPDGLSYPDQILYLELRMLYHQYYQKIIDRDTATKEKKKLLDEYRINQFREEMGKQWVEVIRLTDLARCDYKKNRTIENADRLIEIIEGRNL